MRHATSYYTTNRGKPSAEVDCFKSAVKPLLNLFGDVPLDDFTPSMLKAVRAQLVERGWYRSFCNKATNKLRHVYTSGVENGMVSVATLQTLQTLAPLKRGKCAAPDHKRREAVSDEDVESVRPHLAQNHRDLFDLLRATGARPSKLRGLSMQQIDTTEAIWFADLNEYKNAHRGLTRKLFFGPKSRLILRRRPTVGPLFAIDQYWFATIIKGLVLPPRYRHSFRTLYDTQKRRANVTGCRSKAPKQSQSTASHQ